MEQPSKSDTFLSGKVAKSGLWVFALSVSDASLGLLKLLIVARLLAPSDFGLLGVAFLIIATLDTFSQTGLDTALIQMKDDIKPQQLRPRAQTSIDSFLPPPVEQTPTTSLEGDWSKPILDGNRGEE